MPDTLNQKTLENAVKDLPIRRKSYLEAWNKTR